MADIKGISYGLDNTSFLSTKGGTVDGNLAIGGNLLVDGKISGEGSGGGSGSVYAPMDLPDITFKIDSDTLKITWTDPDDTIDSDGSTLVKWAGTKVVYRTDHYASSVDDGTLLVDNTVRNQYKETPIEIQNVDSDIVYYIQFFAYSDQGVYNTNPVNWRKYSKKFFTIVDFETGTDEEIEAMLNAHYNGNINIEDYWHVGDTRKIHLNGIASPNKGSKYTSAWTAQDITIVITALNHHDLKEQIGIRTKAAVTVQTRECLNGLAQGYEENGCVFVNLNNDYDTIFKKWSELPLRTWMNGSFLTTCFSTEMQNLIKETRHRRLTQYNTKATEEVIDKLFLPSYPEIFGDTEYGNYLSGTTPAGEEGTQWDYYKTPSNRVKKGNNNGSANSTSCYWWQGSASSYYETRVSGIGYFWCNVHSDGNAGYNCGGGGGTGALGLAPAFAL